MPGRTGLNVLFVGGVPPFPVGSALSNGQLLSGLVGLGYAVRAVVPTTSAQPRSGEVVATGPPGVDVTPFTVPYFDIATGTSSPEEYRRLEDEQIREKVGSLIADQRPDVILVGRELYVPYVSGLAMNRPGFLGGSTL